MPTSKSTDQLNIVNSARNAGNDSSELNRQHLIQYAQPEPIKDTGRDAGITQIGQMHVAPPDTQNKQDFQLNSSRDADERNTGNQQAAMYSNRDASEMPNQTENFLHTQDSTGQTSGVGFPRYSENQGLGIYSSTSRGVASPSVKPKNTHDLDERTRDQSEDKGAFKTKAFAKFESSELHELDEKRISREHQFSGVKEQGSNSPRQLSPKPANYSGKKETGGLQAMNTRQQYGTQYGKLPEEAGNPSLNYNHPYQQQPPANPGVYTRRTDMSDYTKGIDNMHMAIRPPDDYPGYNPHERTPAIPGAHPGQIEETRRPVPAYTDFSKGVDSTQYHTRPEQPPTAQDGGYTNEPYKQIDDGAYTIPVDPYRDELRNPRVRISPKDDFSQAVSDKNTGINDPNPVRNNPHAH